MRRTRLPEPAQHRGAEPVRVHPVPLASLGDLSVDDVEQFAQLGGPHVGVGGRLGLLLDVAADLVGQNGDDLGPQVGADHERLLCQASAGVREVQRLGVQERPAEELVRREQRQQPILEDVGALAVGVEDRGRGCLVVDQPPDEDVGLGLDGALVHLLQGGPFQAVRLPHQVDVLAPGDHQRDVAAAHRRPRRRQMEHPHVRAHGGDGVETLLDPVVRSVVGEDDLVFVRGHRLFQHRPDTGVGAITGVVHRHHHADLHIHAAKGATPAPGTR